jgi:hypothetical protein
VVASSIGIGVLIGISVQAWKSSRDELRFLCDEFCKAIAEAADVGAKYWLTAPDDADFVLMEAKIEGHQRRLSGYAALLRRTMHRTGYHAINACLTRLFDALTGGEFKSPDRPIDKNRALEVQTAAADAAVATRVAFLDKVRFASMPRRLLGGLFGTDDMRVLLDSLSG